MVKLQAAKDEATQQRREVETLRGALQSNEGPFFAQMQQGMQHHVQGALRRAFGAEQALDAARNAHAAQIKALEERLLEATDAAQEAAVRVQGLETEAAQLKEAAARYGRVSSTKTIVPVIHTLKRERGLNTLQGSC